MSYPVSAPVDFSAPGPVVLTLTNTLSPGSIVWDISTDASDGLVAGTNHVASADVLHLFPDSGSDPRGAVQAPRFRLVRGGNYVNLDTDPALAASYKYNFPANAPTGSAQIIASSGATNVFYDVHPANTVIVRQNPGPNEFSSIAAAVASISTASAFTPFVVQIYSGVYFEPQIVIKQNIRETFRYCLRYT